MWSSAAAGGIVGLIARIEWLYLIMRMVGAGYLIWMGVRLLKSCLHVRGLEPSSKGRDLSVCRAVCAGFLTNISNPKVAAYYVSLLGVAIPANAPTVAFAGAVLTALLERS